MKILASLRRHHPVALLSILLLGVVALSAVPAMSADANAPAGGEVTAGVGDLHLPWLWWIAPIAAIIALVFARKFYGEVKRANPGDEKMVEIAGHVTEGALAYLKRQYKIVAVFFLVVFGLLLVMSFGMKVQHEIVPFAFLIAGFFSGLCGWFGMKTATMASSRAAQGAKESLNRGLVVAFRAGAVMGLVVVGFGLLDVSLWFIILNSFTTMGLTEITVVMLAFGMGASSQALFARVGGGIYTKAADVGADLVGKVEAGIPEDDPRNPATIADNVGDNVGDVAGMGADLYESNYGSILASMALAAAAAHQMGIAGGDALRMVIIAPVLAGLGILCSILSIFLVRAKDNATFSELRKGLHTGVWASSGLIVVVSLAMFYILLSPIEGISWLGVWGSIVVGLVAGLVIAWGTEFYTSYEHGPTLRIAENAETGPGTVMIAGLAEGMKSTWVSLLVVIVAILAAFVFAGGASTPLMGLFGVGIAAVGMLSTLGITMATDAYGPIADNAGGNAEMTGQSAEVRERTDALDSLGNTTAAVGKGFAIGSAALTALALMAAYIGQVRIGLEREGGMAIVAGMDAQSADDPNAGVGKLQNMGFGKIAWKAGPDKYDTVLVLSKPKNAEELPVGVLTGAQIVETDPDSNLHKITTAEGLVYRGVPASKASLRQFMDFYGVNLMNPKVLCGIFAGVLLVFLFSAMTMKAVGRAAMAMVREVRRQFKEIPGILEGTGKPDYSRCVEISTAGAQREMVIPSLLAIVVPIAVGLVLGVSGVIGLLAGGLACGFAMAIFMANAGGAWDNAKKFIETGAHGGKGSDAHKAAVVGDTVGDPFKDTSGPSLNILIKLMSMVSVVFAGLIVKFGPQIGQLLGIGG
ncbi:MAG: sodium-translocating pyrophosphatase [Planctomycetota bacterium]